MKSILMNKMINNKILNIKYNLKMSLLIKIMMIKYNKKMNNNLIIKSLIIYINNQRYLYYS